MEEYVHRNPREIKAVTCWNPSSRHESPEAATSQAGEFEDHRNISGSILRKTGLFLLLGRKLVHLGRNVCQPILNDL